MIVKLQITATPDIYPILKNPSMLEDIINLFK